MSNQQILRIRDTEIMLEPAEGVFMPSPNGLFYANSILINSGEQVIDIGTGSGVLAIMAAKLGAHVEATDIDTRAIVAAERNAYINKVKINFRLGSLFADSFNHFDVIVANLPNEIVAPEKLANLDIVDARVFEGGERGNEHILSLLNSAKNYMSTRSRLYLPIHTLTDYHQTLEVALRDYKLRLVNLTPLPVKSFVTENLNFYRQLNESGIISIYKNQETWYSYGYVYEAMIQ
jgi:methylase of polypeptide subunit release factors